MKTIYFIFVINLFLLTGCASGPKFSKMQIDNDEAVLYVYRPFKFVNGGVQPVLRINGLKISKIIDGGYTAIRLDSGEHEISLHSAAALVGESEEPFFKVKFKVSPKQEFYFRWKSSLNGLYGGVYADTSNDYGFVSNTIGMKEIISTNFMGNEQGESISSIITKPLNRSRANWDAFSLAGVTVFLSLANNFLLLSKALGDQ